MYRRQDIYYNYIQWGCERLRYCVGSGTQNDAIETPTVTWLTERKSTRREKIKDKINIRIVSEVKVEQRVQYKDDIC